MNCVRPTRLGGREDALPDFERDLVAFAAAPAAVVRRLPPFQDLDVALCAGGLERALCVAELEAGVEPPVEHLDEAGA